MNRQKKPIHRKKKASTIVKRVKSITVKKKVLSEGEISEFIQQIKLRDEKIAELEEEVIALKEDKKNNQS